MKLHLRPKSAAPLALAVLVTACGRMLPASSGQPLQGAADARAPQKTTVGKLTVSPAKLEFTSSRKLTLSISETGYDGAFKIADAASNVAGVSKTSAKGPGPAKITVTAKVAGAGSITVTDSHGGKAKIPFSVTTTVVVVH